MLLVELCIMPGGSSPHLNIAAAQLLNRRLEEWRLNQQFTCCFQHIPRRLRLVPLLETVLQLFKQGLQHIW